MSEKYASLGVDAGKKTVRDIWKELVDNDFPDAFVNIVRDPEYPGVVFTHHLDGSGSKAVQRALVYAETGDITVFQGDMDDALQMNLGDIAASGFVFGKIVLGDVVNIRHHDKLLPKDQILRQFGKRLVELKKLHQTHGFSMYFTGGETADLPDQVVNLTTDVGVYARARETDIIQGNVQPKDVIYGFQSDGQAVWEDAPNSGLMANGFTLARPCLMSKEYNLKYPHLRGKNHYSGKFKVGEFSPNMPEMSVSNALISPTRQWSILIRILIQRLKEAGIFHELHGISMNTGGGMTKIGHVGHDIHYEKHVLFPPHIFQLIQEEGKVSWEEMYKVFNCGWGIDVVGENSLEFDKVISQVAIETHVAYDIVGRCLYSPNGNIVTIGTPYGTFSY